MTGGAEIDFGVATFSDYDDDGHLVIQEDSPGLDNKAGTIPSEAIGPGGLVHRPLDPEKDAAGTPTSGEGLLTFRYGDRRHFFPLNDDVRVVPKLPKVRKGGTMLYGGAESDFFSFIVVDGKDPDGAQKSGSITALAPYSSGGTKKSHFFSMLVREAAHEAVILTHGEGHGLTLTTTGKRAAVLKNPDGSASISTSDDGNVLRGKTKVLGALTVGDPGVAEAVVLARALITYLSALEAALAKGNALGPIPVTLPIASVAEQLTATLLKGK